MKPVKCPNGHYYDAEKYSACPHCDGKDKSDSNAEAVQTSQKRFSFLSREGRSEKKGGFTSGRHERKNEVFSSTPTSNNDDSDEESSSASESDFVELSNPGSEDEKRFYQEAASVISDTKPQTDFEDISSYSEEGTGGSAPDSQDHSSTDDNTPPLKQSINSTNSAVVSQDSKTIGFFSVGIETEPVVGWLVCVNGQYIGESFNLKAGRNNIGRSLNMDIPLAKEGSVSRDRHAIITFDPKKRTFILQPGEGNGLTYHNDELVITYVELKDYDVIQLGQAEFVFSSFCNENFSWDKYLK